MKKLLSAAVAVVMGATLVGTLAACNTDQGETGNNDANIAKSAIDVLRQTYGNKDKETPSDYTVLGQVRISTTNYSVDWTVAAAESCTIQDISPYVSVGTMNETSKQVPISISKAQVVIDYTLNASVTVGSVTESISFERYVPQSLTSSEEEIEVSIDFTGKTNRTVFTDEQQVWTQNGITLTNDKGSSITNITQGDSAYHVRLYQTSNVKIEYPGMIKLVFHSDNTNSYHSQMITALESSNLGTVTSDTENATVTLVLTSQLDVIEFVAAKQMRVTGIDIVANKNGTSDEQKVAGAKATLDIATKNYTATGTYDLPATQSGATVTWAVNSSYAEIENGKLKITSLPTTETSVTLTATIKCGTVTDTKDITVKLIPLALEHAGTLADPYSTTDAIQLTKLLEVGATGTDEVYVQGYVIAPGTYNSSYNNFDNLYIAKTYEEGKLTTAEDAFYVFRPTADGTNLTSAGLSLGDLVVFKGKLQNYKSSSAAETDPTTPELISGTCVSVTSAADLSKGDAEKVAAAKEALTLETSYLSGASITLPATKSGATLTWAITSGENVEISNGKLVIASNASGSVTLTVTIKSGDVTDTKDFTFTVESVNYGTADAPLTVTQALALAQTQCAESNAVTQQVVYMTGKLNNVPTDKGTYYQNLYLEDESGKSILVFTANVKDGVAVPAQNDVLLICGYIKNYNGTIEFTSANNTNVSVETNTRGTSAITLGAHENATVEGLSATATNGSTVTFTVTADSGKEIETVKINGKTIEGTEGSYTFTVAGDTTVTVETKNAGDPTTVEKTLSFASKDNRTKFDADTDKEQIWEQNGIKFTNSQGSSTSKVADYANPVRCYASSNIKVECTGMTEIAFDCSKNASNLSSTIGTQDGVTVTVSGTIVTIKFDTAQNEFNITKLTAQVQISSITVKTIAS